MTNQQHPLTHFTGRSGSLAVRSLTIGLVVAAALLVPATIASATNFYVATNGLPSNDGSLAQPLDLVTALSSQGPVRPGDTVWLRGGVYRRVAALDANGNVVLYVSTLNGTASAPIAVRQYPGERVTLDGNLSPTVPVLVVNGTYTSFMGLEITNSEPNRYAVRGDGLDSYGHHNKFINLVIHDTGQGVGFWSTSAANESELYGTLIYNVGFEASDRGHGHSVYAQNANGSKRIVDNIMFNGFSFGIHAYTENGRIDNLWIEGNMLFNHGILSVTGGAKANLIFAGNQTAQNPTVIGNFGYYGAGSGGRDMDVSDCNNGTFQSNYLAGGTPLLLTCSNTVVTDNTLYGPVNNTLKATYPNNLYSTSPSGVFVGVRPNAYEPGRANVVVYNWARQPQVSVNLSAAGLASGDTYEVRDAQNYFGGPVATGTYTGALVNLPMAGLIATPVVGNAPIQPGHTDVEFGVFVVQRVTGGGAVGAPTANMSASTSALIAGQSATLSWATSGATSVSIDQGVGVVGASGSRVIAPLSTVTYTLTAVNATGTTTRTVTVAVTPAATVSPNGTMVPQQASQIVDNLGAVWTIGSGQAILRNGVLAAAAYGPKILWTGGTIYVLGLDNNWWKWTGYGWTNIGPTQPGGTTTPPATTSPDGTAVPPASSIVDSQGAVWTIGASLVILRNGAYTGGVGSKILWSGATIYVLGGDNNWWKWNGSWTNVGATQPGGSTTTPPGTTSPSGTAVPPASSIVDTQLAVWTIGAGQAILRNGVYTGGTGSKLLWTGGFVYVLGGDNNWWKWNGSWTNVGATQPGGSTTTPPPGTSANGTMVPGAAQIVDSLGAVWTIGGSQAILRNGTLAAAGYGTKILWTSNTIYVFGLNGTWWKWLGSGWASVGSTQPV
ncbi:MAG: hypothetical protein ABJC89_00130 [Acidobacteriota bacterium]